MEERVKVKMKYRADIDGLRALAVMAVLFYHAGFSWISGGFIGVDIFFVISGFLITGIIYRDIQNQSFSILHFYERRIRRIFPALFVVCLVTIPLSFWLLTPDELESYGLSLMGAASSLSNVVFWYESGYFDTASNLKPLLHTWSLGVEEQFYFIFPLILLLVWKIRKTWVLGTIILIPIVSLGLSDYISRHYTDFNFYMLPTRMWELMAGGLIAIWMHNRPKIIQSQGVNNALSFICFITITASLYLFHDGIRFPSLYAAIPVYATAILIMTAHHGTFVGRFLSLRPVVLIGLASYSIYLWHQPILVYARHYTGDIDLPILISIPALILSIGLGFLSLHLIEKPFRNKNFLSTLKVYIFGIGAMGVLFASGLGTVIYGKYFYDSNNPAIQKILEYGVNMQENYRNCKNPVNGFCTLGDKNSQKNILLWGDSHAGSLAIGLDKTMQNNNLSGYVITSGGCPPLLDKSRKKDGAIDNNCVEMMDNFKQNFPNIKNNIDTVILSMRWTRHLNPVEFDNTLGGVELMNEVIEIYDLNDASQTPLSQSDVQNSMRETIQYFQDHDINVIAVYPVPAMGWHVPKYLIRQIRNGESPDGSIPYDAYTNYSKIAFETLNAIDNIQRVYPHEILCDDVRCHAMTDDGIPLYFDDDHLSPHAAELLAEKIYERFMK